MPQTDDPKPSFSSGRRWLGALNTVLAVAAVLALAVMFNYLSADRYFFRFHLSRDAAFKLSSQTRAVLNSLTNDVQATIFFQPDGDNQEIYGLTSGLLTEYQNANPIHLHVRLLDYTRFPGPAKEFLAKNDLSGPREKDFVLFESNGHAKVVYARELAEYDFSELMAGRSKFVRRSAFKGELLFTSDIYAVTHPQARKTYFLTGHHENNPGNPSGAEENLGSSGYSKLAAILKQELDSDWDVLSLRGTNDIPRDCQLLIVAGPREGEFLAEETNKIAAYLKSGGRLMALLTKPCGLEPMLSNQWGVRLGNSRVTDKDPRVSEGPYAFLTSTFNAHTIVNPLAKDQTGILMVYPRPVYSVDRGKMPGAPEVTLLAYTSASGIDENKHTEVYPLLAAVEQGVIKGVDTPRGGGTQIVVAGDSDFLDDEIIDSWPVNHDFAKLALSWLLQRPQIMIEGLASQPIKEYKLYMTSAQSAAVGWLFLGAMPASILVLGGFVWLRRRH
jgi:hypothetical protein